MMMLYVVRMSERGRPLSLPERRKSEPVRGNVMINHESNVLGRSSVVARMTGGLPLDQLRLPELMDCQLHSMSHNAFVLSGLEEIDGVTYAQAWLCRAEPY